MYHGLDYPRCFSKHLAPGSWLLAPGSWLLAPGSWHLAPGSWLLAPAFFPTRFDVLARAWPEELEKSTPIRRQAAKQFSFQFFFSVFSSLPFIFWEEVEASKSWFSSAINCNQAICCRFPLFVSINNFIAVFNRWRERWKISLIYFVAYFSAASPVIREEGVVSFFTQLLRTDCHRVRFLMKLFKEKKCLNAENADYFRLN
jgi:hypothetical protein